MQPAGVSVLHLTAHLTTSARVRWELRKLRRAQRSGRPLDALTAAARIHALAVRPNMRGVIECLHADAARAAREAGDQQRAKLHLTALAGYLRDRRAPVALQAAVTVDLAEVLIAAGDARAGGRILAGLGPLITGYSPGPVPGPRPPGAPARPRQPASANRPAAAAVPAQRQPSE
jgi:hypothetical protein